MTFFHESATEWAEDHSLAADVRFGRLETVAFQRHPEIFRAFGEDGAAAAKRASKPAPTAARRVGWWVVGVLAVVGALAPIAAIAILGGDRFDFFRIEAQRSVPLASVFYGITAITQVAAVAFWVSQRARWEPVIAGVFIVALVFSGFGLVSVPNTAEVDGFSSWQAWYPPVVAAFVLSLLATIAMFVRFRVRYEPPAETTEAAGQASEARDAIGALPPAERQAIRADRDSALERLHSRGLIDDATFQDAVARDLGTLYALDNRAGEAR